MTDARKPAAIYARTNVRMSSPGDSIAVQEKACRDAAAAAGYDVKNVFVDHMSGLSDERPGFGALLGFLDAHRGETPIVFIENTHRLARSVELLYKLRETIAAHGGEVRCVDTDRARDEAIFERERD